MKKITINALLTSQDVRRIASAVGSTIANGTARLPKTTVFALTLTDRELLSAALTELDQARKTMSSDGDFEELVKITKAMDKINKVLSSE